MIDDLDAARARWRAAYEVHNATLVTVPGADTLIALYDGRVPSFHDADILSVQLTTQGGSALRLALPYPTLFDRGRVIVNFEMGRILDADLDFFGTQNVVGDLFVRPAQDRPDRRNHIHKLKPGDLEIEIDPSVGLGGIIVCRGLSLTWSKDRLARAAKLPPPPPELLGQ